MALLGPTVDSSSNPNSLMGIDPVVAPGVSPKVVQQSTVPNTPTPQPWTNPVTVPAAPAQAAQAAPGLLGATNNATAASNTPTLLSDQVNKVTDPNSPIMQRAVAAANEASNDKGLLNSSMGVGAAENAVLQAAVPIATGDVNAMNTAGLATQQQQSQASLSNAQQANAMQTAQAQLTSQSNLQNAQAQNAQIMSQMGQENQVQLNALNNQYQSYLNTNQNASTLYNNVMAQIGNIQSNSNIDAATKSTQIQQMMTYLNSGLSMMSAVSGLNLSAGLNFGNNPGTLGTITQPAKPSAATTAAPVATTTTPARRPLGPHGGGTNARR